MYDFMFAISVIHCPLKSSQWHHNERDGVSNHRRLDCLLSRWFTRKRKHQSSVSLAPHNGLVTRKIFPFDDVIMERFCVPDMKFLYLWRFPAPLVIRFALHNDHDYRKVRLVRWVQYHVSVYFFGSVFFMYGKMSLFPSTLLWMIDYEAVNPTDHCIATSSPAHFVILYKFTLVLITCN